LAVPVLIASIVFAALAAISLRRCSMRLLEINSISKSCSSMERASTYSMTVCKDIELLIGSVYIIKKLNTFSFYSITQSQCSSNR